MSLRDLLALVRHSGLGRRRLRRLLELFSTASRVLDMLQNASVSEMRSRAETELEALEVKNVALVPWSSPAYPSSLSQIPDAPLLLYVRGDPARLSMPAVAVVGSRQASDYGRRVAGDIARDLASAGVTVVSGLARGIDTAAHIGALKSSGPGTTVAVLGSGLDSVYPRENRRLAEEIAEKGSVVSEYPLGAPPERYHFPERNRVISGLSRGTVVVEAGQDSGSLITVDFALEQGREVFAVPGSIYSPLSQGPHRLLGQGARICAGAADILEELGLAPDGRPPFTLRDRTGGEAPDEGPADGEEEQLLLVLDRAMGETADRLADKAGLPSPTVLATLLILEIKGLVRQLPGGLFIRN